MKKINYLPLLCILILFSFQIEDPKAKVDIQENNFLNALIDGGFDSDNDSIISKSEAEAVSSLSICELGITDMKGIEAFVNLKVLACSDNQFASIDISNLVYLRVLRCNNNQLDSLDVSKNKALTILKCCDNRLHTLDVSNNPWLRTLQCDGNPLSSLDLSTVPSIKILSISKMPTLNQVCVWTMPFPPTGVEVNKIGSPNVNFTSDCAN
jgi:Leucine-rich repeat (LRR) protein